MKIIYITDDGKEFDNEFQCLDYEWSCKHANLQYVKLYDSDHAELTNFFECETYINVAFVYVPTRYALQDLHELAEYTGFNSYNEITSTGGWSFDSKKMHFKKVVE